MRDKLVQCFQALLRSLFLHEANCEHMSIRIWCISSGEPVSTISTATAMLTASSTFPITALTNALPHRSRISGLSYIVFANFTSACSEAETLNSL